MARRTPPPRDGRPPVMSSGMAVFVAAFALAFGALLNADALLADAQQKPFGAARTNWLRVWRPVHFVSHLVALDRPREWLDDALDREAAGPSFLDTQAVQTPDPAVTQVPEATPTVRPPTREEPLTLWVGGDSMAQVFGQSLVRIASDTGLIAPVLDYRISTGLSRPDVFDWPAELARIRREADPEVMVIVFGANDSQGLRRPDGEIFQPLTQGWRDEYRRRVAGSMDLVAAPGRVVIWVGQPVMRDDGFSARLEEVNQIYREEAARRPGGILFFDSWELFADANGQYSAFGSVSGSEVELRQGDGIHLTRAGGDLLATEVLRRIETVVGAPLGLP